MCYITCPYIITLVNNLALHQGIRLAIDHGARNLIIEGDNLLVINFLLGKWSTLWQLANTIDDIKRLLHHTEHWEARHVYREANRAADWLANVGHLVDDYMDINCNESSTLSSIIVSDKLGLTLERRGS